MSTIDAAIIKTLSDHLIDTSVSLHRKDTSENHVLISGEYLTLYNNPSILDVIALKRKDSDRIDYFICLSGTEPAMNTTEYKFYWVNNDSSNNLHYIKFTRNSLSPSGIISGTELAKKYEATDFKDKNQGIFTVERLTPEMIFTAIKLWALNETTAYMESILELN